MHKMDQGNQNKGCPNESFVHSTFISGKTSIGWRPTGQRSQQEMSRQDNKKTNYNRRQSIAVKSQKLLDLGEDFVQSFLHQKGLTQEDVRDAFELLSSDGRRITKEDVTRFFGKYFGSTKLSQKQQKWIAGWKEEIGTDSLSHILLNKPNAVKPFDEAFEVGFFYRIKWFLNLWSFK